MKNIILPFSRFAALVALPFYTAHSIACGVVVKDPLFPRGVLQSEIESLVHKRAYAELDRRAVEYRSPDALTSDGSAKLLAFNLALVPSSCGVTMSPAEVKLHRQLLTEWKRHSRVPDVAAIALARLEADDGWRKRGGGYASSVTEAQWVEFRKHIGRSAQMLDALGPEARKDPTWYVDRYAVGRDQGWDRQQRERLYREAVQAFPQYFMIYYIRAAGLTERWGGSPGELESFIDEAERSPANKQGPGILYARLKDALWANPHPGRWGSAIENARLIEGYKNLLARYPDVYNNNKFAWVACNGLDPYSTRDQLNMIGERISLTVWGSKDDAKRCLDNALHAIAIGEKLKKEDDDQRAARRARRLAEPVDPNKKYPGM